MPNRKTARSTPKMVGGFLSYPTETALGTFYHTVKIDSPDWLSWLKSDAATVFSYELPGYSFTVRREKRQRGSLYWFAYKKVLGTLKSRYIGPAEKVTAEALAATADHFRKLEVETRAEQVTQYQAAYAFSGAVQCKDVLARFEADFEAKWRKRSVIDGTNPVVGLIGRQYVIDRVDRPGERLMFQNAARLSWWLADYLVNGRPNFAALRYR